MIQHSDHSGQYPENAFSKHGDECGVPLIDELSGRLFRLLHLRDLFSPHWNALLALTSFETQAEARMAVFDFIEGWYNHRRHSALDYLSPIDHE